MNESPREALGRFLRERRENVAPERVGIASHRGRRTPGLRREEVAFLADIGVKWYARLEAGDEIHPSTATLTGIAIALQLSNAELEYMLGLAGLQQPMTCGAEIDMTIPAAFTALLDSMRGVAATFGDRILTPLRWNAISDALYGHSRCKLVVERNALVRSLLDPNFIAFLGAEREELVLRAVGMFRLNFSSSRPSPLAAAVYDKIKGEPLFQRAWTQRIVAHELTSEKVTIRNHAIVGRLAMYASDYSTPMRPDVFLRTLVPADEETALKFECLEKIGKKGSANIALSLAVGS
jgi:hypothetical protein